MILASAKDFKEINNKTLLTSGTTWEAIAINVMRGYTVYHRYYKNELDGQPLGHFARECCDPVSNFITKPEDKILLKAYAIDSGDMHDKLANYELESDDFSENGEDDYFYVVFTKDLTVNSDALFLLRKD